MIRRFYVHNFRCLENFELPIGNKSTALLIGWNGSGKSTICLALTILQQIARGVNKVDDLVKPKDLTRGRSDVPIRFEIDVEVKGHRYNYSIAFELPEGDKILRVLDETLNYDNKPVYSRKLAEVNLSRNIKDQNAKFFIDWHLVALPIIQEQSSDEPLTLFKQWLANMLIFQPIPALISGESNTESLHPNASVTNFGEWFSGIITQTPAAYARIDKYLKQIMPDLKAITNPLVGKDSRSLFVEFSDDTASAKIPFEDLSDGEKCFMICALVLTANAEYGPLVCYWDEPDNYLAPHEVGHLVMALRKAFDSSGQFIMTSHNIEAISRFSNENTIVLHRHSHVEPTTAHTLDTLPLNGDLIGMLIRGEIEP